MKKGIFSSLVLASCLFATSVASASEFLDKYPNVSHMNKISLEFKLMPIIEHNQHLMQSKQNFQPSLEKNISETNQEILYKVQKENECINKFVNSSILLEINEKTAQKISTTELVSMENFLIIHPKPFIELEKLFNYAIKGDIQALKKYQIRQEITNDDNEAFKIFAKEYQNSLKEIDSIILSESITSKFKNYIQSCKS